ncbi:hypothetical protein AC249_AIPGENE27172 [Exaiptasia diaphana]|nr:hypothetical protein AC249_AIPGENE27172 [Exaiptasia diaphana]
MIPEIIVYYLFNIYTCIATVVGAATTIIVIRIYYPRNGFKIAYTNKKANIITNKPLINGNTTALTVIKEQPGSSSLLAGCFLPGLLVIMFVIVVVLKWRSNKTRQQHMMAKTIKIISIKRQITEYKEKIDNCDEFLRFARQKQLTGTTFFIIINIATKDVSHVSCDVLGRVLCIV